MFFCVNITAFDNAVVPDVNTIDATASKSIFASKKLLSPASINSSPLPNKVYYVFHFACLIHADYFS